MELSAQRDPGGPINSIPGLRQCFLAHSPSLSTCPSLHGSRIPPSKASKPHNNEINGFLRLSASLFVSRKPGILTAEILPSHRSIISYITAVLLLGRTSNFQVGKTWTNCVNYNKRCRAAGLRLGVIITQYIHGTSYHL